MKTTDRLNHHMKHHYKHWIHSHRAGTTIGPSDHTRFEITYGILPGVSGRAWHKILTLEMEHIPYRHEPFEGDMRAMIESMVDTFPGIMDWSYEEWEEFLRKEPDPKREIRHWTAVAKAFQKFAEGKPLEYRMEVFPLLGSVCCHGLMGELPMDNERKLLPKNEVDAVLEEYYGHYLVGG